MELPPITRRQRWAFALAATFTMTISYVDRQTLAVAPFRAAGRFAGIGPLLGNPALWRALLLVVASACLTVCIALMPRMATPAAAMAVASLGLVGGAGLYAMLTNDLFARIAPTHVSTGGGFCAMAQSLAIIVAMPLVGASVQAQGNYRRAALYLGLWALPGAATWILWRPPAAHRPAVPA